MLFQTLDDKTECVGIYTNNGLVFDPQEFPTGLSRTWKYVSYLRDLDIEYASLYLEGRKISEVVPEYLKEDWEDVSQKINSFKRSLAIAQVDTGENCFFDLIPERFLMDFCEVKNSITDHVLKSIPKPKRYQFYKHVSMMLEDISHYPVTIDRQKVASYLQDAKLKNHAKSLLHASPCVKYNQFGTRTGRLTTYKGALPILTLSKDFRSAIHPQNDFYIELDFNGAEVRTLLGLLGKQQPAGDVHEFHMREIFTDISNRNEAKVAFFAWLYGSRNAADPTQVRKLTKFYEKGLLLDKYWDGKTVRTPFGKEIEHVSDHHALNYLVQSTAAELALNQALKVEYLLRTQSAGSHIAFIIHDAVILDMKKEDEALLTSLSELMSSTNFGKFMVNIKKGKTLGSMKEVMCG